MRPQTERIHEVMMYNENGSNRQNLKVGEDGVESPRRN